MNRSRLALVIYTASILIVTMVHRVEILAVGLAVALALAGRDAGLLSRRVFRAVVLFNGVVTASYMVLAAMGEGVVWRVVLMLNLRVFLLTFLTALFVQRVNLFSALSFSRALVYVLAVAHSQVVTYRRLVEDYRLAFASRAVGRPRTSDRYRHAAAMASLLIQRALRESTEVTAAMTSRGFFDD